MKNTSYLYVVINGYSLRQEFEFAHFRLELADRRAQQVSYFKTEVYLQDKVNMGLYLILNGINWLIL